MKVERFSVLACCGKTTVAFKISAPLSKDNLPYLIGNGFTIAKMHMDAGMLYAEDMAIILSGPFGQNVVHAKCKVNDCTDSLNKTEELLSNMG